MPYIDKEKFRMHIVAIRHNPLKAILTDEEKEKFIQMLDEVPTADVVSKEQYDILLEHANILAEEMRKYQNADVPKRNVGKWIDNETSYSDDIPQTCTCSVCGLRSRRPVGDFCKWCGADMREETEK